MEKEREGDGERGSRRVRREREGEGEDVGGKEGRMWRVRESESDG